VNRRNPAIAWTLGWLLPGAGHWYLGQRARALVMGGALAGCFAAGVLVGGRSTVSTLHPEYLVIQWGTGLPAAAAWAAGDPEPADLPVGRRDLGILYTLVPSLLNLVAALDASARATGANPGAPPGPAPVPAPAPSPAPAEGRREEDAP
jgi:hypothetical protein